MRLALIGREKLQALGTALVAEFDNLVARIRAGWNIEHNEEGSHTELHAETVTTGRLVFSDVVAVNLDAAITHNFDPGIETASVLRADPKVNGAMITGIRVPLDAAGTVLDGRVLILENATYEGKYLRIAHELSPEGQGSFARNRFRIPWQPAAGNAVTEFVVPPSSFVTLMYNATVARWYLASQRYDNTSAFQAFTTSLDDFNLGTSPRAMRNWRLMPDAPDLFISGFQRDQLPDDERKTVINDGRYTVSFLHASTRSALESRIYCPGGVRYLLHPRESVELQSIRGSNGGWRILTKADQWIDVPYNAANFYADGGTWTVEAADVVTFMYQVDGNKMTVIVGLNYTVVTGSPLVLSIVIPDGRVVARETIVHAPLVTDGVEDFGGLFVVRAGGTTITVYRSGAGGLVFAPGNVVHVRGEITFMIRDDVTGMVEAHTDLAHSDVGHGDADHSDIAHVNVAHVDTHGDGAHADASHTDIAHTDQHTNVPHYDSHGDSGHADTHSDVPHTNIGHSDVAHADQHTNIAHYDVPHVNIGHDDEPFVNGHNDRNHEDAHYDAPHGDEHEDVAHVDEHYDDHTDHDDFDHHDYHLDYFNDVSHEDTHGDTEHDDTHYDVSHEDQHGDQDHADEDHEDHGHKDVGHGDAHTNVAHQDQAHSDGAHSDTHSDVPFTNSAHQDVAHSDSHNDVTHLDTGHADTAHADTHTDAPHTDGAHTNVGHADAPHGDTAHQDQGLHTDAAHVDM